MLKYGLETRATMESVLSKYGLGPNIHIDLRSAFPQGMRAAIQPEMLQWENKSITNMVITIADSIGREV